MLDSQLCIAQKPTREPLHEKLTRYLSLLSEGPQWLCLLT